jgi:hypothetical protein
MERIDSLSSTSYLEVGWRRGKQGGIYSLVDGGGGTAHRKQRRRGGGSPVGHKVGNNIAKVRSPCELEWGKRRKDGMGFARQGGVRATHQREEKRERVGVRYRDEGENESRQRCRGKRGVQCKGGKASVAPCSGHASMAHMGPATDGFCRARSDRDPASVERSPGTGATSHRCSNYSRLQEG